MAPQFPIFRYALLFATLAKRLLAVLRLILCLLVTVAAPSQAASQLQPTDDAKSASPQATVTVKNLAALRKALSNANPGDIIALADGVYENPGSIQITTNGEPQKPITVRAATPGGVTFKGDAQLRITANCVIVSGFRFVNGKPGKESGALAIKGNMNRVTECSVIDYNEGADLVKTNFWVAINGQKNRVDHCYFKGKKTRGVLLFVQRPTDAPDYTHIDHNVFRDIPRGENGNGYETIRIGTSDQSQSDSFSAVYENYFENCDGETEIISIKSGKNVIHQNTLVNCAGSLTLRHGAGNTATSNFIIVTDANKQNCCGIRITDREHVVENNYIAGIRTKSKHLGGLVLMSSEGEGTLKVNQHWRIQNITLRRNTVIDCQQSFVYGGGEYGVAPLSVDFEHNLVARPQGALIRSITDIVKPVYVGELYQGAPFGKEPLPKGIDQTSDAKLIAKQINGYTLYAAESKFKAGADLEELKPLRETDVGPSYKN